MTDREGEGLLRRLRKAGLVVLLATLAVTALWWGAGRLTAASRSLTVRTLGGVEPSRPSSAPAEDGELRVLTWNLAHGRGDARPGLLRNWSGGSVEERAARLARIALILRQLDADVVVLNEVDFRSSWSGGLNQAEVLARAAGYPTLVQQTNYDVRLPFASFWFGNVLLTRLPVRGVERLAIPPHRRIERILVGAKRASLVRLDTGDGPVDVVPVHLEPRSEATRLGAVPVFAAAREREPAPMILAGDFNTSPAGWPGAADRTAVSELLERGWRSPRALGPPGPREWTFETFDLARAIDWVLVEPPLRAARARVIRGVGELSDHAPVVSAVMTDSVG